jgi:hypothetical protein
MSRTGRDIRVLLRCEPAHPKRLIVSVSFIAMDQRAVSRHVLNGTAQIARTGQTEVVANEKNAVGGALLLSVVT